MNHRFLSSVLDSAKCSICKQDEISHTDMAVCQACTQVGPVDIIYGDMMVCPTCKSKELALQTANNTPEKQNQRVNEMNTTIRVNQVLREAEKIDQSVQIISDLFNVETESIKEIKQAIDIDDSISNKPYALAESVKNRFDHYTHIIFTARQLIQEATSKQRANQVYMNTLANQLRTEEREKLKIHDINYSPSPVKSPKIKPIKVSSKKLNKEEIRKFASELTQEFGKPIPEYMIQMLVVRGLSVKEAADKLRVTIKEGKSE